MCVNICFPISMCMCRYMYMNAYVHSNFFPSLFESTLLNFANIYIFAKLNNVDSNNDIQKNCLFYIYICITNC